MQEFGVHHQASEQGPELHHSGLTQNLAVVAPDTDSMLKLQFRRRETKFGSMP